MTSLRREYITTLNADKGLVGLGIHYIILLIEELLIRNIYIVLTEAKVLIEQQRQEYNQVRLYSALKYQPLGTEDIMTLSTS